MLFFTIFLAWLLTLVAAQQHERGNGPTYNKISCFDGVSVICGRDVAPKTAAPTSTDLVVPRSFSDRYTVTHTYTAVYTANFAPTTVIVTYTAVSSSKHKSKHHKTKRGLRASQAENTPEATVTLTVTPTPAETSAPDSTIDSLTGANEMTTVPAVWYNGTVIDSQHASHYEQRPDVPSSIDSTATPATTSPGTTEQPGCDLTTSVTTVSTVIFRKYRHASFPVTISMESRTTVQPTDCSSIAPVPTTVESSMTDTTAPAPTSSGPSPRLLMEELSASSSATTPSADAAPPDSGVTPNTEVGEWMCTFQPSAK